MFTKIFRRLWLLAYFIGLGLLLNAQVIRPYNLVYSDNLKGGCTIVGNTLTHIVDTGAVNLTKMNETGNAANGVGGLGHSQYGNDFSNIQFADVDGTLPATSALFGFNSAWKYLDNNTRPTDWETTGFNDAGWAQGNGELGFGEGDETTVVNGGPSTNRYMTIYFRKTISIPNTAVYGACTLNLVYDDGAVVYVNGVEVGRVNMPATTITHTTGASMAVDSALASLAIPMSAFVNGNNVIAVEIHQRSNRSDDLSFDAALLATNLPSANTVSSSSADLLLPGGTNTIKFARLYWGGRINNSTLAATPDTLRRVKIRKGTTGGYVYVVAPAINTDQYPIPGTAATTYQSYVDVTNFIQTNGSGTYMVADIPASTGAIDAGGNFAGWCIVVAYENTALPFSSIRIYDGYLNVFNGGTPNSQSAVLTGLNVDTDASGVVNALLTAMVWEGDANLRETASNPAGDYLKINNVTFSNAVNPATNMWNGSISRGGAFVTTKSPHYTNQMGIDIDEVQVGTGYGIQAGDTTLRVEFGTEADRYFPSLFSLCIGMRQPAISLDKLVSDANGNGVVESGELLTYTLNGTNMGQSPALNCMLNDSLPSNVTYVPQSLEIISCPGLSSGPVTDALDGDVGFSGVVNGRQLVRFFLGAGASGTAGGQLLPGQSFSVRFKVQAATVPGSVINTARITAVSAAGLPLVDDGTAVIGPLGGAIPVKLTGFTATLLGNGNGLLQWATASELNHRHFIIERSTDGLRFDNRGQVDGQGNGSLLRQYQFTDPWDQPVALFYYRLKMVDTDGQFSYSPIVALRKGRALGAAFTVYPNPFAGHLTLSLEAPEEANATITMMAANGQTVHGSRAFLQKGNNVLIVKQLGALAAGQYWLRVNAGDSEWKAVVVKR
jgi:uncharacterized repeat protein (TIGR01451 family)